MSDAKEEQPTEDAILKPQRRKPNFTPEQRAALAERMRKVNADRIAKAKGPDKIKEEEEKKQTKEQKRKELEEEIERLKQEAQKNRSKLEPVPKARKPRVKKPESDDEFEENLLKKAREVIPDPPSPVETPVARTRKVASVSAPPQPKIVCKFL